MCEIGKLLGREFSFEGTQNKQAKLSVLASELLKLFY